MAMVCSAPGAIISGGPGNGAAPLNDTAPGSDPGFGRVGQVGTNGSGVYLGGGWVITANHVSNKTVFNVDGVNHSIIAGTGQSLLNPDTSLSDIYMFKVSLPVGSTLHGLNLLDIATTGPVLNDVGTFIGTGVVQSSQVAQTWYVTGSGPYTWSTINPGGPHSTVTGFEWDSVRDKRWAQARVDDEEFEFVVAGRNVHGFLTEFDAISGYGNGSNNDSGSPIFLSDGGGGWLLAGVAHTIFGFEDQPASTTMHGNATFWSDLSVYRNQILTIIPEPATALVLLGLAPFLVRRRRD